MHHSREQAKEPLRQHRVLWVGFLDSTRGTHSDEMHCYLLHTVDETRVVLKPIEGAEHDYVDANFIEVSGLVENELPYCP